VGERGESGDVDPDGRRSDAAVDCTDQLFRSRALLEAEILVLQQQINVLRRKSPKISQRISTGMLGLPPAPLLISNGDMSLGNSLWARPASTANCSSSAWSR
jgi:hypothetical protein